MGSFIFKWAHPASEVYVTGTFDDWAKSVKLEKVGDVFEKEVELAPADKTYYKFVVDNNWTTDHTAPQETDEHNNVNNVLLAKDLKSKSTPAAGAFVSGVTPQSTTAQLAGQVPKETRRVSKQESEGSPPESPFHDAQEFKVDPIPATAGIGNPISLKPGQKVPPPSTFTQNTVDSTVTTDKASYENGPTYTPQNNASATAGGAFGILPVSGNMIPESSLPMGASKGVDVGPTIQSAGAESTTAALAGQVPKQTRGVPPIVAESFREAGVSPEASANAEAVKEKSAVEKELESKVPEEPATSATTGVPIVSSVPDTVQESIAQAHQSPEAAANKTAVEEKKQVETELLKKVETAEQGGAPAPSNSAVLSATAPAATDSAKTAPAADSATTAPATTAPVTAESATTAPLTTTSTTTAPAATKTETPVNKAAAVDDSRDVSPMSKPGGPTVTTGVGSSSTPTKSTPPSSSSPAAVSSAASDKKSKRSSGFFGKIKAKFHDKDKKPS